MPRREYLKEVDYRRRAANQLRQAMRNIYQGFGREDDSRERPVLYELTASLIYLADYIETLDYCKAQVASRELKLLVKRLENLKPQPKA